ncbi:MAG: hypothetical protein Q4A52_05850 [Bacillota bacterium]|nr:hypothetical protein [Bacillota bacterium]
MADNIEKLAQEPEEVERKKKNPMGCLIILFILFLTPVLVVTSMYFLSREFRQYSNTLLSAVPGPVGDYFGNQPTRADELAQVRVVSDYMLSLDDARAADKLKVLQKEDRRIYDEVVRDMLRLNPNRTRGILDAVRLSSESKDALSNVVRQIETEQIESLKKQAEYLSTLPANVAIEEIVRLAGQIEGHKLVASIFEYVETSKAVDLLYQLDAEDKNRIFSMLSEGKANEIRTMYSENRRKKQEIVQLAGLMRTEDPMRLAETLQTYSPADQATILRELGAKMAGSTLRHFSNDAAVLDLVARIKNLELLEKNKDELTPDLLKALKIYKDYDDRMKELVSVYTKMPINKVTEIVRDMLLNMEPATVYELDNGDHIAISDEDLTLDILRKFPQKKIAEILAQLDNTLSSELTRKLALPSE